MDIDYDLIIEMQRLDTEIREASLVLEGIPRLVQDIDKKIQTDSKLVADAKGKMSQNQKKRRDLEAEVKDIKVQIGKYKRQLNEVKSNKEYTSLLKEIEEAQHKVDSLEEAIIAEMLTADDVEEEIKTATHRQGQDEESLRKEKLVLDEKMKETEATFAALNKERESLLPRIPPEQMMLYESLRQKKGGAALSPVTGDFCAMCHMRVRPQMLNEIRDKVKVILCENCGRILYWTAKPEPAKPEPPATG
ncbi:MAG: C4-type zinc ribbon domain-containing protein [Candidatus Aminicenantes bacterium]|nr:C4-type zinc ribbon domain-containing protein [Candidatus Aminicenantes bacterium]